ncbi:MAG: hypothetical protein M3Y62_09275 [Candidatus Dormibacteraeota bacterium]|uniref:hypothetical protein n=1 Tax=Candidatus Dormibacter sp. TaxID=2973982 RepID=UPI000DB717AA|nr:hypothetical protein [Candidatus Dormibacteraeota bacterium]PZR66636.1 MAG: hypothetical protein DLM66_13050 [Candidatus Dormibacteraeota bacterium]
MATAKRTATMEEVLAAIEAGREKVMADDIRSLSKLGIPKSMAVQIVASRFRQKGAVPEEVEVDPFESTGPGWDD